MLKKEIIEIMDDGTPLTFEVQQMPALKLARWVSRAVSLLARSGLDLDGVEDQADGSDGFFTRLSYQALSSLDYDEFEPLMLEMLECCWRTDGGFRQQVRAGSVDGYVNDYRTIFKLCKAAFEVNLGFFGDGAEREDTSVRENTVSASHVGVSIPRRVKKS